MRDDLQRIDAARFEKRDHFGELVERVARSHQVDFLRDQLPRLQRDVTLDPAQTGDASTRGDHIERELMLVKVRASGDDRARVMEIAEVFRVNVVDVTNATLTLEATGKPEKLEALLSLLADFGVVELSRTGRIALGRGERGIRERVLRAAND